MVEFWAWELGDNGSVIVDRRSGGVPETERPSRSER